VLERSLGGSIGTPVAAADAAGNAIVAWAAPAAGVSVSRRRGAGSLGAIAHLAPQGNVAGTPSVAVGGGRDYVAWRPSGAGDRVVVGQGPVTGPLGTEEIPSGAGTAARDPYVDVSPSGVRAVVAWVALSESGASTTASLHVARSAGGSPFALLRPFAGLGQNTLTRGVAAGDAGEALLGVSDTADASVLRVEADGTAAPAMRLTDPAQNAYEDRTIPVRTAIDAAGRSLVVFGPPGVGLFSATRPAG
jgi:hypothetical protein